MFESSEREKDSALSSGGIIDTSHCDRRVWLVKVPDFLEEAIGDIEEDGLEIGTVRATPASPNSSSGPEVKLFLNADGPCRGIPMEYDLKLSKASQTMHIFCEDAFGKALVIEGKVEQECHLRPVISKEYLSKMKERTETTSKSLRTVQMMDDPSDIQRASFVPHTKESVILARKKERRLNPDNRKERMPKQDLINILFNAFEGSPHWSFKALVDHTLQPSLYLKEVLSEIAIFNIRGPYKNLYELKPDYKS